MARQSSWGESCSSFAGGTAATFEEFMARTQSDRELFLHKKVPDFISRLRGVLDIEGINCEGDDRILRRALVLQHQLKKRAPHLCNENGAFAVDGDLLASLLDAAHFKHGARSLEALLDMSTLNGAKTFDAQCLPALDLRTLHLSSGPLAEKMIGISVGEDDDTGEFFPAIGKQLLLRGAHVAYGGDKFTDGVLEDLVRVSRTLPDALVRRPKKRIHNYLAFPSNLSDRSAKCRPANEADVNFLQMQTLASAELSRLGVDHKNWFPAIPSDLTQYNPTHHLAWAISLFRMRRRLVQDLSALIVVGGKVGQSWGRFSGIVEEVLLASLFRKPVYILGGVPGAAQVIGRVMGLDPQFVAGVPVEDSSDPYMDDLAAAVVKQAASFEIPEYPQAPLGLQEAYKFLASRGLTSPHWCWNGLTAAENRELFQARLSDGGLQPCVNLILNGLTRLDRPTAQASARNISGHG